MEVKFKKLVPEAVLPSYSKVGDAGLDLTAISIFRNDKYIEYGTGLAVEIPEGFVGLLFPRSSVSKTDLVQANSVGVIDSGYRGEIKVRFKKVIESCFVPDVFQLGERIAQLMIIPYPTIKVIESDYLSESERGEGGFGHTGK